MRVMGLVIAAVALTACDGADREGANDGVTFANGDPVLIDVDERSGATSLVIANRGDRGIDGGVAAVPGFVRPIVDGALSTAGYLTLQSSGDDALTGAAAPYFGAVELHEVTDDEGVSRMRRVDEIALPDDEIVQLRPGGYHLMLMQPLRTLDEGDKLPVLLTFESGLTLTMSLPVERQAPKSLGGTPHEGMDH